MTFTALQQDLRVLVGMVDGELRLAHKAMAANHAIGRNTEDSGRDHFVTQQQSHRVYRTHEVDVGRAQRISFGIGSFASELAIMFGSSASVLSPFTWARYSNHSPLSVVRRSA